MSQERSQPSNPGERLREEILIGHHAFGLGAQIPPPPTWGQKHLNHDCSTILGFLHPVPVPNLRRLHRGIPRYHPLSPSVGEYDVDHHSSVGSTCDALMATIPGSPTDPLHRTTRPTLGPTAIWDGGSPPTDRGAFRSTEANGGISCRWFLTCHSKLS
ncbi:hypothetical protein B296_00050791 [Ensete ventricosum]|uniref:Uncharacterized protein n=1 Tax=Ensete ventricosum TaxID=4639 RepID=A0A426YJV4_ENSVE|nr:hypothetical protein B296_00050791 [Ensete ventricosum]